MPAWKEEGGDMKRIFKLYMGGVTINKGFHETTLEIKCPYLFTFTRWVQKTKEVLET